VCVCVRLCVRALACARARVCVCMVNQKIIHFCYFFKIQKLISCYFLFEFLVIVTGYELDILKNLEHVTIPESESEPEYVCKCYRYKKSKM